MSELERFFQSIQFTKDLNLFKEGIITKVVINKKLAKYFVYLNLPSILDIEIINELFKACKNKINGLKDVEVILSYTNIKEEDILKYLKYIFQDLVNNHPSLYFLIDANIQIKNREIIIEVTNKMEELLLIKEQENILRKLIKYGLTNMTIKTYLNAQLEQEIKDNMNQTLAKPVVRRKEKRYYYG